MRRIALFLFLLFGVSATNATPTADDALQLAEDTGRWLAANAIEQETGVAWPSNALNPESIAIDLASGSSGVVIYFAALYQATGNRAYLGLAERGADYLVAQLDDPDIFAGSSRRASLYAGLSGVGVALIHINEISTQEKYAAGVARVISILNNWAVEAPRGKRWSDQFNDLLYGDAGTALFLAHAGAWMNDEASVSLAVAGGHYLLSEAREAEAGKFWHFRRDRDFNLPNFSHGTAGVAYVLATLGDLSGDDELLRGARAGFEYVNAIAEIDNGILRIPYGWGSDSWDGLYEFGWAHGITGSSNLFARLQQVGIDDHRAAQLHDAAIHTLTNINLPDEPRAPFAEPSTGLDLRFGRAGVLRFLSAAGECDGRSRELRASLWTHLVDASRLDDDGIYWEIEAPAFMGGGRAAYTGMFHGAAGIGLASLRLYSRMTGTGPFTNMPDDAYAGVKGNCE